MERRLVCWDIEQQVVWWDPRRMELQRWDAWAWEAPDGPGGEDPFYEDWLANRPSSKQ